MIRYKNNAIVTMGFALLLSCCTNNQVEKSLKKASDNREELEKVLVHYQDSGLKLEAARFLIGNMDAHYWYATPSVEAFYLSMDSLFTEGRGNRDYWKSQYDTLLAHYGGKLNHSLKPENIRYDVEHLTADYLISQIDSAFKVWHCNWNSHYDFETFCRYVLPYRIGHEPPTDWRDCYALTGEESECYDQSVPNKMYVYGVANSRLHKLARAKIYYPSVKLPDFPLTLLSHVQSASCKEYSRACVALLRALGIPSALDFVPQWGNRSMGHEWCAILWGEGVSMPVGYGEYPGDHFQKRTEDRLPKVFRQTYEKRPESLSMYASKGDMLPPLFDTPCLMDVTADYVPVSDVRVPLRFKKPSGERFAYLSVFDNQHWKIVHWGRIMGRYAEFSDMGRDVVYLPVYYTSNGVQCAGDVFLLDKEGNTHVFVPDESHLGTMVVKRKFREGQSGKFLKAVCGGRFQVSGDSSFTDVSTLATIGNLEDNKFHEIVFDSARICRYFRYLSPDDSHGNMSEITLFDDRGDTIPIGRLSGNFHVREGHRPETLFDGDVLSYYDSHERKDVWVGIAWDSPVRLKRIVFLPRNDDNFIRDGEVYELFYWKNGKWISLGRQTGTMDAVLVYHNAPSNALFLLHNHTKGQEERIFTYENGKQYFW